jgi:hypothetical protein
LGAEGCDVRDRGVGWILRWARLARADEKEEQQEAWKSNKRAAVHGEHDKGGAPECVLKGKVRVRLVHKCESKWIGARVRRAWCDTIGRSLQRKVTMRCELRWFAVGVVTWSVATMTTEVCFGETAATSQSVGVDRSTPTAGLKALMKGLEEGNVDGVVASVYLAGVGEAEKRAYAESLIAGSRLYWLLEEKFGEAQAERLKREVRLIGVEKTDAEKVGWERHAPLGRANDGVSESAFAKETDSRGPSAIMVKTAEGWKSNLVGITGAGLPSGIVEDAAWLNGRVARVMEQVKTGKLATAEAVKNALLLQAALPSGIIKADRSTPEGTVAAIEEAIEKGDVAGVADAVQWAPGWPENMGATAADEWVLRRKLRKVLVERFKPEQADRVIKEGGLRSSFMERYSEVGWVIDGDVARAAFDPPQRYDPGMKMVRKNGKWRVWVPAHPSGNKDFGDKEAEIWTARVERMRNVLEHLDQYKTPGDVLEVLNSARAERQQDEAKMKRQVEASAKEMDEELKRRKAAKALTPEQAEEGQLVQSFNGIALGFANRNAEEAAKYFYVKGDADGAYPVARMKRLLAARDLASAVDKEIGNGASGLVSEFGLVTTADDGMGMRLIEWKFQAERAVGKKPEGVSQPMWIPELRKVDGVWKIDVTPELRGKPEAEAKRAEEEARSLGEIAGRVKEGKVTKLEEVREAMRKAGIRGNPMRVEEP